MNPTANKDHNTLESTVRALGPALAVQSQGAVMALVRHLAEREGISIALAESPGLQTPAYGIHLWLAKLRDELLDREIFTTLEEARILIKQLRKEYTQIRPHSALGYRPSAPEAIMVKILT